MTKLARADNFFGSCFTRQEKGVCESELDNEREGEMETKHLMGMALGRLKSEKRHRSFS